MDSLLTTDKVSELTGIPIGTLYSLRHFGKMPEPTTKVGRSLLWDRATIEAWMEARAAGGDAQSTEPGDDESGGDWDFDR